MSADLFGGYSSSTTFFPFSYFSFFAEFYLNWNFWNPFFRWFMRDPNALDLVS
jgi:hypothetical protein